MTAHVQIDSAELRRQHEAHKARAARFVVTPKPEVLPPHVVKGKRADAHIRRWRSVMYRPTDLDVMFLDEKMHVDNSQWKHISAVKYIISAVSAFYGVPIRDILSQRRTLTVVRPRQVAMYLSKTLTIRSLPEIGRIIGGRDHTTILHGVRKITQAMETDKELARDIAQITERLMEHAHADS